MRAYLVSYFREAIVESFGITVADDYDGNPYGDSVRVAVGSNQDIVYDKDDPRWPIAEKLASEDYD